MPRRYDAHDLGQVQRTPQGGIRAPGRVTRTGVFTYLNADGSTRREWRPPEEVFAQAHLDTIKGAPVTNLHPGDGRVDAADWRQKAIGHAGEEVRRDGIYVETDVYVQDRGSIDQIESGARSQISLGYDLTYDPTPGVTPEGEAYDGIQRDLRVNHIALVPRGRAGAEVGLRLDAAGDQLCYSGDQPAHEADQGTHGMKIKIGGVEYEAGSPEAAAALEALEGRAARVDALERAAALADLRARLAPLRVEIRTDADPAEVMMEVVRKYAPGVAVDNASPDYVLGAFSAVLALKLGESVDASEEPEEEPEAEGAAPPAPPAPGAAAARADAVDARRERVRKGEGPAVRFPGSREDADTGEGLADKARRLMVERGRSFSKIAG